MSGGGSKPKMPAAPAPSPVPEQVAEGGAGAVEARLRRKQRGRLSTILTEGGLGVPEVGITPDTQKKSLLG